MKSQLPISVFVLAVLALSFAPLAASAQAGPTTIYVVQPGDTAFAIANRYCMTVQELQNLNGAAISNPNQLYPGMQLRVVNRCGSSGSGWNCGGGSSGVFDRGPNPHARGTVYGDTYTVALGDTSWSISQRFGISVIALCQANGINPWYIWAGQRLVIPGLTGGNGCQPPAQPCPPIYPGYVCPPVVPVTPIPTVPAPVQSQIWITSPTPNATLPPTFTVTGSGQGLFEGSLVVRATTNAGVVLAEQPTTLQGSNVGAGGPGTFSVQLSVNVPQASMGFIVAFAPQSPNAQAVSVPVTFWPGGTGGVTYHEYSGQQCRVVVLVGQPFFAEVGDAQLGTFANPGTFVATRGAKLNNQLWFFIGPVPGSTPSVWTPITSIGSMAPACWW